MRLMLSELGFLILITFLHCNFDDHGSISREKFLLQSCSLVKLVSIDSSFSLIGLLEPKLCNF